MADSDEVTATCDTFGYRWTEKEKQWCLAQDNSPIDFSYIPSRSNSQASQLSRLELLPLEIFHLILGNLDPASLLSLRVVGSNISEKVRLFPVFQDVAAYMPGGLKALFWTQIAGNFTISYLHQVLQQDRCAFCKSFAPYVYLIHFVRCCLNCLGLEAKVMSETAEHVDNYLAANLVDSSKEKRDSLKARCYRGLFNGVWHYSLTDICDVINEDRKANLPGESEVEEVEVYDVLVEDSFEPSTCIFLPVVRFGNDEPVVENGIYCRGCESMFNYLISANHHYEALYSKICFVSYSRSEFRKHVRKCNGVKELKKLNYPDLTSIPDHLEGVKLRE